MLRPLVQHMWDKMAYRVLPLLDDFLIAPTAAGTVAVEGISRGIKRDWGISRAAGDCAVPREGSLGRRAAIEPPGRSFCHGCDASVLNGREGCEGAAAGSQYSTDGTAKSAALYA